MIDVQAVARPSEDSERLTIHLNLVAEIWRSHPQLLLNSIRLEWILYYDPLTVFRCLKEPQQVRKVCFPYRITD